MTHGSPAVRRIRRFAKRIESLDAVFDFLAAFYDEAALGEAPRYTLSFVVEEIFTNMVKYNEGSSDDIEVTIERSADGVVIELTENDVQPWDPSSVTPVDVEAPLDQRRPGRLGLHLVRALADRLTYEYRDRSMKVSIHKSLPAHV